MLQFRILIILITNFTLASCASNLRVVTFPPGANIYFVDGQSKQETPVGQTPLELAPEAFGDFISLEIERKGYRSVRFLYPSISGYSGELNLALVPQKANEKQAELLSVNRGAVNNILSDLFLLQERILSRNIEQANQFVERMDAVYAELAIFQVLKGNLALLQKNRELAVISYRKALAIDPGNTSALFFLRSLGERVTAPASEANTGDAQ